MGFHGLSPMFSFLLTRFSFVDVLLLTRFSFSFFPLGGFRDTVGPSLTQRCAFCGVGPSTNCSKPYSGLYTPAEASHELCARFSRAWSAPNKFCLLFGNMDTGCSLALLRYLSNVCKAKFWWIFIGIFIN